MRAKLCMYEKEGIFKYVRFHFLVIEIGIYLLFFSPQCKGKHDILPINQIR